MIDLYATLGVKRSATTRQIRDAFRRLSKKLHPDAGGDHDAFAAAQRAHHVLTDPARRVRYDATGEVDESCEGAEEGAALGMLGGLLQAVLQADENALSLEHDDVARLMREELAKRRKAANAQIAGMERLQKRAERMRGRWSGKDCRAEDMLTGQIANLAEAIKKGQTTLGTFDRADELLKGWKYRADKRPAQRSLYMGYATNTTAYSSLGQQR